MEDNLGRRWGPPRKRIVGLNSWGSTPLSSSVLGRFISVSRYLAFKPVGYLVDTWSLINPMC